MFVRVLSPDFQTAVPVDGLSLQVRRDRLRAFRPSLFDTGICAKCGGPYGSVRGTPLRIHDHFDLIEPDPEPEPTERVVPVADDRLVRRDEGNDADGDGDSEAEGEASEPGPNLCLTSDLRRVEKIVKMLWRFGVSAAPAAPRISMSIAPERDGTKSAYLSLP